MVVCGSSDIGNWHCQLEEHPVGDIKPVEFILQYLTLAVVKLPSASDGSHGSVQHML